MSRPFRFRLEPVLELRRRREELLQMEFAQAIHAVAAQQEKAVAAERAVEEAVAVMRGVSEGPVELLALRAQHDEITRLRRIARHEREMALRLEEVAEERREDMVRASQERRALDTLRSRAEADHRAEEGRREQIVLDELALRRSRRPGHSPAGAAA